MSRPIAVRRFVALVSVSLLGAAAGCVGHTTYPPLESDPSRSVLGLNAQNDFMARDVATAALHWAVRRYPVEGEYAVNMPAPMTPASQRAVLERLNEPRARLLTSETKSLPIYHLARIWVRGDEATVDVFRPEAGSGMDQAITLKLRGGVRPWRVVRTHQWMVGAQPAPALRLVDDPGVAVTDARSPVEGD